MQGSTSEAWILGDAGHDTSQLQVTDGVDCDLSLLTTRAASLLLPTGRHPSSRHVACPTTPRSRVLPDTSGVRRQDAGDAACLVRMQGGVCSRSSV